MKSYCLVLMLIMLSGCSQGTAIEEATRAEFDLALKAATDQSVGSGSSELDAAVSTASDAIMAAVNVRRALAGIPPLIQLPELTAIAGRRSVDMAAGGYLGHVDPLTGKVPVEQLLEQAGFNGQAAELLYHSQGALSLLANEVAEAWFMDSSHQLVLLSLEFRYIGIGIMGNRQGWIITAVVAGDLPRGGCVNNRQVADIFLAIADLLEIKGETVYKVLAYRKAGEAIHELGTDLRDIWQEDELKSIPGVGTAIAEKIDELYRTGKLEFYEKLTSEVPSGLVEVLAVGDVGPKKAARFWQELGITSVAELERAARAGELQKLSGMGAKSEARILENIETMRERKTDRMLLDKAWAISQVLLEMLRSVPGVLRAEAAGSIRRYRETVGDLDLVLASSVPGEAMKVFVNFPQVARVLGKGDTKTSVELHDGTRVQVWVHPPDRFGSAWQYASGAQAHNVRLRERALRMGVSLSEHGFKKEDGTELICPEESQVYEWLGLAWIPPELREDRGEIAAAEAGELPELVELVDILGELHAHSDWSDGAVSMREMLVAGRDAGLSYFVISDHSRSLGIANGLSLERLEQQREELAGLQAEFGKTFKVLHGAEVEILADGSLDYPDEVLAELDIVIASLHTSLRQTRDVVTERLLRVISNPHVDIIGHLTGRLIGKRAPADLDIERIVNVASAHQVALEINSNPERLDVRDVHARMALDAGCLLAINTDAHHPDHLNFRQFGVGTARRAWAESESIINTWPVDRLQAWLSDRSG